MPEHHIPNSSDCGVVFQATNKTALQTNNPFEAKFGYFRAVKRGPLIAVSGTTAARVPSDFSQGKNYTDSIWHPGDAKEQALLVFKRCCNAVQDLGGKKEDIIRVRMFVVRHEDCGVVGEACRTVLGHGNKENANDYVAAAATMIVVPGGFVDKDMLVEVEVDAYCL